MSYIVFTVENLIPLPIMLKHLVFCSMLLHTAAFAQRSGAKEEIVYLDNNLLGTSKKFGVIQGSLIPVNDGYIVQCNSASGNPLYIGTYADKKLQTKQGLARYYHANGALQAEGMMEANLKTGVWRYWHENKQLKDSANYAGGYLEGVLKSWHANGQLKSTVYYKPVILTSVNTQRGSSKKVSGTQINGDYLSYYDNGKQESKGMYNGGIAVGKWEWYRPNGQRSVIEYFDRVGKLDSMRCFDSLGADEGDMCSIAKPAVLKGFGSFREYVANYFTWPDSAFSVKQTTPVRIRFTVNVNGKLEKLRIESSERVLAEAIHRFIRQLPEWYPAVSHNREVNWKEEIEVLYWPGNKLVAPYVPTDLEWSEIE